ncbi:MAG TPA: hypothetical protein VK592_03280, partial [Candidatus Dormibacteraeota bacterium]|nr:hypothetical protein [Candidatus Dormibacteraeota bacterium]
LPVPEPTERLERTTLGDVTLVNEVSERLRFPERGGLRYEGEARYRLSLQADDSASCRAEGVVTYRLAYPGGPTVASTGRLALAADESDLLVTIELDVQEDGRRLHQRRWEERIPRDLL